MPRVLTTNAIIVCPHGGVGTTTPATPLWQAQGGLVAAEGDVGVLSCIFIVPCVGYTLKSMGLNATTMVGRKVVLATDFQRSITGLPLSIVETHTMVDDSTPAPLPAGAGSAPGAPELLDVAPPVVAVVSPPAVFTSAPPPPKPPTATLAFTLNAPYPLQWTLTFLNTIAKTHLDVTNGVPPGIVVAPSGGAWTTPALTVTVTITVAFAIAQGLGTHELYMTGVTRRGLSAYAKGLLVVS
jgi:hypothetical protein